MTPDHRIAIAATVDEADFGAELLRNGLLDALITLGDDAVGFDVRWRIGDHVEGPRRQVLAAIVVEVIRQAATTIGCTAIDLHSAARASA